MNKDRNRDEADTLNELDSPESSCASVMTVTNLPPLVRDNQESTELKNRISVKSKTTCADQLEVLFEELERQVITLLKKELKRFKRLLRPDCLKEAGDEDVKKNVREGALNITLHVLKNMNQNDLAHTLQTKLVNVYQDNLKSKLRDKCRNMNEGIHQHGPSALLNEIYTELYITEGWSGEISDEHEVRQIEAASRRPATQEKPIKCNELFKDKSIRTVLTKGVAGIGKTVSVQKFILDWAEGETNQDIMLVFPLPFRELNLIHQEKLSLMNLLHQFFPEMTELQSIDCNSHKVLFILDGLDESRLPLNFQNNKRLCDGTESASVDVLLTNLIKGNLLPSALLWITSRPAAASQIPHECVDQVTEVRGFSDPQKEGYFRKRISDQNLANQMISHMKSSRSLYIMCHIPVFCWISATVLEKKLGEAEGGEIPKTLTQMFIHFLIFKIKHKDQRYPGKHDHDHQQSRESILALGKLAFQQLEKGNLIFYEEDLRECGLDVRRASVYSGVCTQIFREEVGLQLGKVFSFVHLSVQEFLAALFVFLTFISKNATRQPTTDLLGIFKKLSMSEFLKSNVNKALRSKNGQLDLFLRFLLGLSVESNHNLLQDLLPETGSMCHNKEETIQHIKKKISGYISTEKSINLFHCLNELGDQSLEQEVQTYLKSAGYNRLSGANLSPAQWSALVFVLMNSKQELNEFILNKYYPSEGCLLKLLPVVKASRRAGLWGCNLTEESCAVLSSVLISKSSTLRELDLSYNELQDPGVKLLSVGLQNPSSHLEILELSNCCITQDGCAALVSALRSNPSSRLTTLNLSYNNPGVAGVKLLCDLLQDPHCNLKKLELYVCNLTERSFAALSSALSSSSTRLRELDLSNNILKDPGLKLISAGLQNPNCNLETLRVEWCQISKLGLGALVSALTSNPSSHLRELNLSDNNPGDSGVTLLSDLLKDPQCKLEKLDLTNCSITDEGCSALASALKSNPSSQLRDLKLTGNRLGEPGKTLLSDLLHIPNSKLENLDLQSNRF